MSTTAKVIDMADAVQRQEVEMYYRQDGELVKLKLLVPKAPVEAEKVDVEKKPADKNDNDTVEKSEEAVVELLTKYLTQMYNQGSQYLDEILLTMAADGSDTILGVAVAGLEKTDGEAGTALHFLRTKRRLDYVQGQDVPILHQFSALATEDLNDPETARYFPENVVADYKAMEPKESRVRLLVIENLVVTEDPSYIVMQRMFCYVARGCDAASGDAEIDANDRKVAVHYVAWGYSITERADARKMAEEEKDGKKKKTGLTEEERQRAIVAQDRLGKAQQRYVDRREQRREAVIRARLPQILEFITMACATSLVRRMDEAAPNLPPKMMLSVPIEKAGSIIDKDGIVGASYRDVQARKAELIKESHEMAAELKKLSELAAATDATPVAKAEADAKLRETISLKNALRTVEELEDALTAIDPEREVLLHLCEKGWLQDSGRDIKAFFKIVIPYDAIRKRLGQVKTALESEDELKKAEEKEADEPAAPAAQIAAK